MKIRFTVIGLAMSIAAAAQQDPQFSQNMFNRLPVNPGYAGSTGSICGTALGRSQWLGFDGAPQTFVLAVDAPLKVARGGIGLTLMQDAIGVESSVTARVGYAYRMSLAGGTLGIGLDLGMINKTLGQGLKPLQANDPSIPAGGAGATVFDAGLGLYFSNDKFYAGLSSTHLPQATLDLSTAKYQMRRHYYVMAGYNYQLSNPDLMLVPSIFLKNAVTTQFDLNCNVFYKKKYWGGLSYRMQDAIVIMAGANVWKDLRVGLAYDVNTSRLNPYNNGTLEFMLNYCMVIKNEPKRQVYRNVRYL
jgi:type IX secretion system PorP/SprF family membrane protein